MLKFILRQIFTLLYKVKVSGLENYHKAGEQVLIVVNHLSFIDAMLIATFLPGKPTFAVNTFIASQWWMKPFLALSDTCALDPTNPMATKSLIQEIKKGKKCVIFPEGRITVTGSLMKVYEGPGMIADKSGALILPIRLDGAQYTPFSRLKGHVKIRRFPQITLTILKPIKFDVPDHITGRQRRIANADKLYDIMTEMLFESSDYRKTLFNSLLDARNIHGKKHEIIVDIQRKEITYQQLITRSLILGKQIAQHTEHGQYVGFMFPNMCTSIVTFFAMQAYGRVPAMLNYSTGAANFIAACKVAKINTICTSKKFIQEAKLDTLITLAENENIKIIYLEDIATKINLIDKITGFITSKYINFFLDKINHAHADDPAVILFTSGSEGLPKGVVLSHTNIQANRFQLASRVDFSSRDTVFNALPIFHSFGLTGGTILPILSGIKTFFYPSPLHYRIIPEMIYDTNSTIMFGTNTFLANYAKYAHAYDFYSLRYVFAGAEKLDSEVKKVWSEKFCVTIFEGYGATETSPALSTNTPMHHKHGTVGRLMPGIQYRLEKIDGINDGQKLLVHGPNIMKGYLLSDQPGQIIPPQDGWYDTGDIVDIDDEGYIKIMGRAKRFAKIGGEMVSLTAVETYLKQLSPAHHHAVVALADPKKGEQLILLTTHSDLKRQDISMHFKTCGASELGIPKTIVVLGNIPLLGTGKTDYVAAKQIASDAHTNIESAESDDENGE